MKINPNKIDFIAAVRHLCWCGYQLGAGQVFNPEINEDQLTSLRDGVKFQLENPDTTAEQNHNNWMKMKIIQGWKYGKVKDFDKKEHPDLIPFNQLPLVEQNKDNMDIMSHKKAIELWEMFSRLEKCIHCGETEFESFTTDIYDDHEPAMIMRCKKCKTTKE